MLASGSPHTAQRIAALTHLEPELLMTAGSDEPVGAVWSHAPVLADVSGLPHHAIALHLGGSTLVEKWRDGRLLGHHARVGSVSLVPALVTTQWVLAGHSRVAHLYVDPQQLRRLNDGTEAPNPEAELRDFYGEKDDFLASLMRAVIAQGGAPDRLAHDEMMTVVGKHLLRTYASGIPCATTADRVTLTAAVLRRLFNHIEERIAGELRLAELAAIARLSEDHFLRAFKAAVGQTPHQFVLGRRIVRARELLERTLMPVQAVALETGFSGPSHFAAAFRQALGTSPRVWRAQRYRM
jgi:AraC family transcriptional regulator